MRADSEVDGEDEAIVGVCPCSWDIFQARHGEGSSNAPLQAGQVYCRRAFLNVRENVNGVNVFSPIGRI